MCLSMIYAEQRNRREMLATAVQGVLVHGDSLIFTDILGNQSQVNGTIASVDLIHNEIVVHLRQ